MTRVWNKVKVKDKIYVPFDWKDPTPGGSNLGRAEFSVCLKFKKGKVKEFWVYPIQTRIEDYWYCKYEYVDFHISSYDKLDSTGAWLVRWCKEHKTPAFSIYAPNNAKVLGIDYCGLSFYGAFRPWMNEYIPYP